MSDKPKWWPENPWKCDKHKTWRSAQSTWDEASENLWNAMQKNIGSDELTMSAILEAVDEALDGNEPSDFMMSFPIVRKAWEVAQK